MHTPPLPSSATVVVADLGSLRVTTDLTSTVIPDVRVRFLHKNISQDILS